MAYLLHGDGTRSDLSFLANNEFAAVGAAASCEIRLPPRKGIAGLHCRLVNVRGWMYVQPLGGRKILVNNIPVGDKEQILRNGDTLAIGQWSMIFRDESVGAAEIAAPAAADAAAADSLSHLKRRVHELLLEQMDLKKIEAATGDAAAELRQRAQVQIGRIIDELAPEIKPLGIAPDELRRQIVQDVLGYGPLDDLLNDNSVTEIMCFGDNKIYIERNGKLVKADKQFAGKSQLLGIIERIVGPLGRRIDESSPLVDARLPDGSRVNAVIPPIAIDGPSLDIRKFSKRAFTPADLVQFGSVSPVMVEFLKLAVASRQNIIISGGTGSGKTTLLNLVSAFIPSDERIVTIEDSAELKLEQEHVVRLETRPPNIEGKGELTIRALVRNSLRMRPDRIVVGECRGGEALDMLQAMNTGHDGSLTTVHANSPHDVIGRLETLVLMAGMELPVRAIRQQISAAVNIICQQSRLVDGTRKIVNITELTPADNEQQMALQDIFVFQQTGFDEHGRVQGAFQATGTVPQFAQRLRQRGVPVDLGMFAAPARQELAR